MPGSDERPASLTIDEWLVAVTSERLRTLAEQLERVARLKQVTLAVLAVVFVMLLALQWQIWARNARLDELEQVTRRVETIATEFQNQPDNSEFTDRVLRGLDQIERLCEQEGC